MTSSKGIRQAFCEGWVFHITWRSWLLELQSNIFFKADFQKNKISCAIDFIYVHVQTQILSGEPLTTNY